MEDTTGILKQHVCAMRSPRHPAGRVSIKELLKLKLGFPQVVFFGGGPFLGGLL